MRIAIASSGLGHVARGIETWAEDTAMALAEWGETTDYRPQTTDCGMRSNDARREAEDSVQCSVVSGQLEVTLFGAWRADTPTGRRADTPTRVALACMRRSSRLARLLAVVTPGFLWRWGFKSAYGWEQWSFWRRLEPELRRGSFDILHVQDPMLAFWCRRARLAGRLRTQEILAHGTEETPEFRAGFGCLQELTPWHLDRLHNALGTSPADRALWIAMPNFVDTDVFCPVPDVAGKRSARARLGIPADAFVVGCVAALKYGHKRLDYLIEEVGRLRGACHASTESSAPNPFLFLAGATTDETGEVDRIAAATLPGRYKIMRDVSRNDMPEAYRCMDVFILPSLFEMMPIAVLEAMASGVPVLVNNHPNLAWIIGERGREEGGRLKAEGGGMATDDGPRTTDDGRRTAGGVCVDMARDGALAGAVAGLTAGNLRVLGGAARLRAECVFSKRVVIGQYVRYYEEVMGKG